MNPWHLDPDLAGRFHPQHPDDLEVIVHDGDPRRAGTAPEAMWVRIAALQGRRRLPTAIGDALPPLAPGAVRWVERPIYRATLLGSPHRVSAVRRGQPLLFVSTPGLPYPLMVGEDYLEERGRWAVVPCDGCGADQALDPPTVLAAARFHRPASEQPVALRVACPCGGVMGWIALGAGAGGEPPPGRAVERPTRLERLLLAARAGATRDEVRRDGPRDVAWTERAGALSCALAGIEPFEDMHYAFLADRLHRIRLTAVVAGDYGALARLDSQVREQLPSVTFTEVGQPWSIERARSRLEGRGSETAAAGVVIAGHVAGDDRVLGKVLAFKRGAEQRYAVELSWSPVQADQREPRPGPSTAPAAPGEAAGTRWLWIPDPRGPGRVLAYGYDDPEAGPSARGALVGEPPSPEDARRAVDQPDRIIRHPDAFGAAPLSRAEVLRLGLPRDPPWLGIVEGTPVPPPRGDPGRVVTGRVHHHGAPAPGARVRIGYAAGEARELLRLDERVTDREGRFAFPNAPGGPVVVIADRPGLSSRLVDVPSGVELEIALEAVGRMTGRVLRAGTPVAAHVSLIGLDGGPHQVVHAGPAGGYVIDGVVPGRYRARVEALGVEGRPNGTAVVEGVAIGAGETVQRDYALAAGDSVRVVAHLEDARQSGHVFLVPGAVSPRFESELRPLLRGESARSANHMWSEGGRLYTEFRDVLPGRYTVCAAPFEPAAPDADQPVASRSILIEGGSPARSHVVELALPRALT